MVKQEYSDVWIDEKSLLDNEDVDNMNIILLVHKFTVQFFMQNQSCEFLDCPVDPILSYLQTGR